MMHGTCTCIGRDDLRSRAWGCIVWTLIVRDPFCPDKHEINHKARRLADR